MNVPYVNLGLLHRLIADELLAAVGDVLARGQFILGDEVATFEEAFARRCGSRYAVGVNSGTDALVLVLKALGVGPGDEVITVPNSFLATASSIVLAGALPVFVDVGPDQNIDPARIADKLSPRTRAIVPVHLTGRPAAMEGIMAIAGRHGLLVIEDCAQAVGAHYSGLHVGTFGTAGCFSLHPLKNLGACGDGGVVVTGDETLYARLRQARNHGLKNREECLHWGLNSRLDTVQAALLNVKLRHLDDWTARRRAHAHYYAEHLGDLPLQVPVEQPGEHHVYHAFVIRLEERDALRAFLRRNGIDARIHYPTPIHLQQAAQHLGYRRGDFPTAEAQAGRILSLPVGPELTHAQLQHVVTTIRRFFETHPSAARTEVRASSFQT